MSTKFNTSVSFFSSWFELIDCPKWQELGFLFSLILSQLWDSLSCWNQKGLNEGTVQKVGNSTFVHKVSQRISKNVMIYFHLPLALGCKYSMSFYRQCKVLIGPCSVVGN